MPTRIAVDHLDLHTKAVMAEFPGDSAIQQRGKAITDALDIAPVDAQDVLDYLDAKMAADVTPTTSKVREWIATTKSNKGHHMLDMAELLETDALNGSLDSGN